MPIPLKGKILVWNQTTGDIETLDGKYFLTTKTENGRYIKIILYSNLKSAVQGLIQEIDQREKKIASEDRLSIGIYVDVINELENVKKLIKKWFPNMIENETKTS